MRWHCLQHVPFEGPGNIEQWARSKSFEFTVSNLWEEAPLPQPSVFDGLVIMGGPMNVYEEARYPWLVEEKRLIESAIGHGKAVFGVCLGAQLIADVLGSHVYRNPHKEIGWFPVQWTPQALESAIFKDFPQSMHVLHWHGDTFELPISAIRMAHSDACENQAFLYQDTVIGLQFHLESTQQSLELLVSHCDEELVPGPYIQQQEAILNQPEHIQHIQAALYRMLDALHQRCLIETN